jgi:DNA-binding CsgD family transcriptional regulator
MFQTPTQAQTLAQTPAQIPHPTASRVPFQAFTSLARRPAGVPQPWMQPNGPAAPSPALPAAWSPPLGSPLPGLDLNASLAGMLDEVDYGMLMVDAQGQVMYRNHAAGLQLDAEHPLQVGPSGIRSLRPQDQAPLWEALTAARRGLRRLLQLGEGEHRVSVAVVPLVAANAPVPAGTLLLLGKRRVCQQLSVLGFARLAGMTAAETRVLEALCAGVDPSAIAQRRDVKMSTVRTQINRIREKCGAASIREVVQQVAMLPPMLSALRGVPGAGPRAPGPAAPGVRAGPKPAPRPTPMGTAPAVALAA